MPRELRDLPRREAGENSARERFALVYEAAISPRYVELRVSPTNLGIDAASSSAIGCSNSKTSDPYRLIDRERLHLTDPP